MFDKQMSIAAGRCNKETQPSGLNHAVWSSKVMVTPQGQFPCCGTFGALFSLLRQKFFLSDVNTQKVQKNADFN